MIPISQKLLFIYLLLLSRWPLWKSYLLLDSIVLHVLLKSLDTSGLRLFPVHFYIRRLLRQVLLCHIPPYKNINHSKVHKKKKEINIILSTTKFIFFIFIFWVCFINFIFPLVVLISLFFSLYVTYDFSRTFACLQVFFLYLSFMCMIFIFGFLCSVCSN